jgi:hypothetical protein
MTYELWDTESGNLIQTYERETDALALVHAAVEAYGAEYAADLALLLDRGRGDLTTVASGRELAERARAAAVSVAETH